MKIGILQTGHAPDEVQAKLGDYDSIFARLLSGNGFQFDAYAVVDNIFPTGADAADGWLITGSKHGAYEGHDWIPPLEQLIRDIYAQGRPMVGICFGHQIIAQALGGTVVKFDGGWSVGHQSYRYQGRDVAINAWHQDQVIELPRGAEVIGSSDFCTNAAIVYGDKAWTIQPHPEFEADFVDMLLRHRAPGVVEPDRITEAQANLNRPIDSPEIVQEMVAFLKGEWKA